jgi:hypothetical protein
VRAPLAQVDDPRRHAFGVEAQAQDVHRWLGEVRGRALDEQGHGAVRAHEAPVAIDDDRRERLVAAQHAIDRLAHRPHLGLVEVALGVRGRVAGGEQQRVPVA